VRKAVADAFARFVFPACFSSVRARRDLRFFQVVDGRVIPLFDLSAPRAFPSDASCTPAMRLPCRAPRFRYP
jgi:hypothetical protein